jgi:hypothetical protein
MYNKKGLTKLRRTLMMDVLLFVGGYENRTRATMDINILATRLTKKNVPVEVVHPDHFFTF